MVEEVAKRVVQQMSPDALENLAKEISKPEVMEALAKELVRPLAEKMVKDKLIE